MTITHKGHPLFLWTNSRLTLGCPAGLSSSLMCSPRRSCRCFHGAPASRQVSSSATVPRPAAPPCTPRPVFTGATASIFPMALFLGGASHKALRHGVPASNKPHPAEKSTPVWLAIWRTWAGFANSQLRRAAFRSIYLYRCAHSSCFHLGAAAQTDANLSAHLHRLPTPPPYLRQMRLSHGRVRGCWVLDETFASQGLRCWVQMMLLVVRGAVPANHRAHESLF